MFSDNLLQLRKQLKMTQEELADRIGVSRQAIAKWENGETQPDIDRCRALAEVFGVTMDDLVCYDSAGSGLLVPPRGKHIFGVVTIGDKGQIVIPAKARKVFGLQSGDRLIVLGDESSGLALLSENFFSTMMDQFAKDGQ